jgi:hypothetical protein
MGGCAPTYVDDAIGDAVCEFEDVLDEATVDDCGDVSAMAHRDGRPVVVPIPERPAVRAEVLDTQVALVPSTPPPIQDVRQVGDGAVRCR